MLSILLSTDDWPNVICGFESPDLRRGGRKEGGKAALPH